MNTELTIQLDDNLIHAAEMYACEKNVSLSKMIEVYLRSIVFEKSAKEEDDEITPLVKSLCGVIESPHDFDYKSEYGNYLIQKYK